MAAAVEKVMEVCPKGATVVIESTVSPVRLTNTSVGSGGKRFCDWPGYHLAHAPERIIPGNMVYELKIIPGRSGADSREIGREDQKPVRLLL